MIYLNGTKKISFTKNNGEELIGTDENAHSSLPEILQYYINSQKEVKEKFLEENPEVAKQIVEIKNKK